jgi:hypothetical protein
MFIYVILKSKRTIKNFIAGVIVQLYPLDRRFLQHGYESRLRLLSRPQYARPHKTAVSKGSSYLS